VSPNLRDHVVALDFGTSTTRSAVFDGQLPRLLPNGAGREVTPTVVSVTDAGTLVAGKPAADRTTTHPERTVTDLVDRLETGDPFVVDGVSYPPETLAAAVLARALPTDWPADVRAVLTVPTAATWRYRRRLRDAAVVADITVERVLHPTDGAAMAFGATRSGDRTVLVCDFGAGTVDASILEIYDGVYEIVATDGTLDFGGRDLDAAVADHLASAFADDHGIDLRTDPSAHRRLVEAAADARADLDDRDRTDVSLPVVTVTDDGPLHLDASLSRARFESVIGDRCRRVVEPMERVLDAAGVATTDLDDVVLVGDAARTPAVRERVEAATGVVPTPTADPGSAAVLGAAIQGGILSGHVDETVLLDVLPNPLGVVVDGDGFEPVVPADTILPTDVTETFTTTVDDQSGARVRVREGGAGPDDGPVLCDVVLTDLPTAPAGNPRIEVTFSVDEHRTVAVAAECEAESARVETTFGRRFEPRLTDAAVAWSRWVLFGERSAPLPVNADPDSPERIAAHRPGRVREPWTDEGDAPGYPPLTRPPLLPQAVGVATAEGEVDWILDAETALPARASTTFTTAADDQTSFRVRVLREGEAGATTEPVGEFTVTDLLPAPAGVPDIDVEFEVDVDGTLTVSAAADDADGRTASRTFHPFDDDAAANGPERVDRSPTSAELERLLDVRDDLTRALDADAADPASIQAGLQATRKKLDRLTEGELTASLADDVRAVADDLDRAVDGDPKTTDRLRRWVRATCRRVEGALDAADVTLVDPAPGSAVDPDRHSVVARVESERPADAVVDVRATGYVRAGRVERPANVTVSDGSVAEDGAALAGPPDTIPAGPSHPVDYDVLSRGERIGSGGRADVFEATVPSPDGPATVALKEPRFSGTLHADVGEQFVEEAKRWARLDDHDHVVGVVDWGVEPLPWIAMEYMDGGTLDERTGDLSVPQALWTALSVARGVSHANKRGVAHLDLKPGNVLFRTVDDAWDVPKVADWGLSGHLLDRSAGADGYTPTYAAPEQFDPAGSVGTTTDVYQLGALCYELFTGRPPFEGDGPGDVVEQVRTSTPPPPSDVASVPDVVDDIVLTALSTEPADRFEATLYLRDALREAFTERFDAPRDGE